MYQYLYNTLTLAKNRKRIRKTFSPYKQSNCAKHGTQARVVYIHKKNYVHSTVYMYALCILLSLYRDDPVNRNYLNFLKEGIANQSL